MKEPIEELFKQSLGGHEMPYNPEAWKAMSARLDAVSPVVKPTSNLKYYLGAAVIGVAAVTTYLLVSGGSTPEKISEPIAKETKTEQTSSQKSDPSSANSEIKNDNSTARVNPTENSTSGDNASQVGAITQGNSTINPNNKETQTNKTDVGPNLIQGIKIGDVTNPKTNANPTPTPLITEPRMKMIMPVVRDLCLNEEMTITNPNNDEISVQDALNKHIMTIPAKKSVVFKPTVVGNFHLAYADNYAWKTGANFQVKRTPDADFTIDLINKYENGLPSTHVQAIGGQGTYVWEADNQSTSGVEADLHFYDQGEHTITLTVDNGQCISSIEKKIYIEQDYNLMAMNSFTPLSNDPRNATFMPFALTQRDVNFVLTIIDGRDGGIVYQTSDASLPWDGTDIRTGRRSQAPQVYVWKAVILNPTANEPGEYRGTVTMN